MCMTPSAYQTKDHSHLVTGTLRATIRTFVDAVKDFVYLDDMHFVHKEFGTNTENLPDTNMFLSSSLFLKF